MRQRIITGALLALFALIWLFLLPSAVFQLVVVLIAIIGMNEWLNIHGTHDALHLRVYVALLISIGLQTYYPALVMLTSIASVVFYLCGFRQIVRFEQHRLDASQNRFCTDTLIAGVLVLSTLASILIVWQATTVQDTSISGGWAILLTALIIIAADVGAYFAGKSIGKSPLSPQTSPKKTWEGALGGISLSICVTLLVATCLGQSSLIFYALCAVLISMASIIGDLRISLSKRIFGMKDSGSLFPGHGGVLDRLDGWLAGFPLAFLLF